MSDGAWGFAAIFLTVVVVPGIVTAYKVVQRLIRIERGTAYAASQSETAVSQTQATGNGFAQHVREALEGLKEGQARAESQRQTHGELLANLTGRFEQHISDVESSKVDWNTWRRSVDSSD